MMPPGALGRAARIVASYLSEAKSHWIPLSAGLEKVRGVRVERMASPMAIDE